MNKVEYLLDSYIQFLTENENLRLEIEALKNNFDIKGISFEEKSSKTNKISHEIEDRIINNDEKIKEYEKQIEQNLIEMKKIENATKVLTQIEKEIIELKYFHSPILNRKQISIKANLTINACDKIKRRAIAKMSKIII